jgi:predicted permease
MKFLELVEKFVIYFIIVILSITIIVLGTLYLINQITIMLPGILLGIIGTVNSQMYLWKR